LSIYIIHYIDGQYIKKITSSELNNLSGITSNIQTQLNNKQNNIIATTDISFNDISLNNITFNGSINNITSSELNNLDGITSNIQTQLNNKQNNIIGTTDISLNNITFNGSINNITKSELTNLSGITSNIQNQLNDKQTLQNIINYLNSEGYWKKSYMVLHIQPSITTSNSSTFLIGANYLLSLVNKPNIQWRWMFGISTGDTRDFVWGFFCAMFDRNRDVFNFHKIAGSTNIILSQNYSTDGWNRLVITINSSTPPLYLNVNIY
jgi:hypothetical protein